MSWRLARSLVVLRDEINALAPNRDKSSDGTIGDESHQARHSDHNPNEAGVVLAADFTHDVEAGADMDYISDKIAKSNHPAFQYVIFAGFIWSKGRADEGWREYNGSNPHNHHCHVSVGGDYDNIQLWGIGD